MPALPAGTIISTLTDANGAIAIQVTLRYDPATLAMIRLDCVNNTGRTQNVLAVQTGGTTHTIPVPTGTTTVTAGQMSAVGINTYTDFGGLTFALT